MSDAQVTDTARPQTMSPDIVQQIVALASNMAEATEVASLPLFVASNKQIVHGVLPLHLRHIYVGVHDMIEEIKDRFEDGQVYFQNIGIDLKTRIWFDQMVTDLEILASAFFVGMVHHFPEWADASNVVDVTRDWQVVSSKFDVSFPQLDFFGRTKAAVDYIVDTVNSYQSITFDIELEKPSV